VTLIGTNSQIIETDGFEGSSKTAFEGSMIGWLLGLSQGRTLQWDLAKAVKTGRNATDKDRELANRDIKLESICPRRKDPKPS